ncbi:MAG: OPT/YSL family transporter [Phycisphaerae bacterium]
MPVADPHGRPIRHGAYPELTWTAVIVGWLIGALIALSIGYAALILGFSIEGSELAAILGWGVLRGLLRRSSIVENNINQTIASAVNGASAGMMFSVPALFILSAENPDKYATLTEFSKLLMVFACITGGILGLGFIIPLRKQMIDFNRLAYPGGIATAAILKSPGAGMQKAVKLLIGILVSAAFYTAMIVYVSEHPELHVGEMLGLPSFLNLTFFLSLMTVGVGYLSGRHGLVFGYGGFICYFVLAPLLAQFGGPSVQALYDPPPQQTFINPGDVAKMEHGIETLAKFDPALASRIESESHAGDVLAAVRRKNVGEAAKGPTVPEILEGQTLWDEALATHFANAVARLEAEAKRLKDTNAKSVTVNGETVTDSEIESAIAALKRTKYQPILDASAALATVDPGVAEAIRTQASSYTLLDEVEKLPLEVPEKEAVVAATRARSNINDIPEALRLKLFRPTGIGILIGAAIGGIIAAFPLVRSAIKSMQDAAKERGDSAVSDEMPIKLLYLAVFGGAVALLVIAFLSVPSMTLGKAVGMALLGTVWIWVAGVIVSECLGRTNWSPLSGMTLIAVTILIFIASGLGSAQTIIASVIVGAAVCVAIAQAGDMMLDLKAGYIVGARPKMQQYGQYLGTWLGPILVIFLIFILHDAYGLGSEKLPAPQGAALASMINGVVGGDVPQWRYTAGAGLGALLAFSGLGGVGVQIGLGFYMPFNIVLTYTIGCLIRMLVEKTRGIRFAEEVGIPYAAGLIVGEALVGVVNALQQVGMRMFGGGS